MPVCGNSLSNSPGSPRTRRSLPGPHPCDLSPAPLHLPDHHAGPTLLMRHPSHSGRGNLQSTLGAWKARAEHGHALRTGLGRLRVAPACCRPPSGTLRTRAAITLSAVQTAHASLISRSRLQAKLCPQILMCVCMHACMHVCLCACVCEVSGSWDTAHQWTHPQVSSELSVLLGARAWLEVAPGALEGYAPGPAPSFPLCFLVTMILIL